MIVCTFPVSIGVRGDVIGVIQRNFEETIEQAAELSKEYILILSCTLF